MVHVSVIFGWMFSLTTDFLKERLPTSEFLSAHLLPDGLKHVEEIKFNKCIYIEDACLERLSSTQSLQDSLFSLEVVSCGNVTDKGVIALHRLRSVPFSS